MDNIVIENLEVAYGDKKVLKDVNLSIKEGSFVCILGRNGSGKSTLIKTIDGLILPTKGSVKVYGMDTSDEKKIIDIRKLVGIAFQNPDNQIVASVVEEDVAFGLENIGVKASEIRERIDDAMKKLSIYDSKDSLTSKLSGGQKQKVAIAGILAMKSKIIILDEPTSMVDSLGRKDILELSHKLNKEEGITIILISHHADEMIDADRVIVLDDGKVVLDDAPSNILTNVNELSKYGIELPYKYKLLHDIQSR